MRIFLLWRILRILSTALRIWYAYRILLFLRWFLSRKAYQEALHRLHRRSAARIREQALSLRGVLIKVGQFLSARIDVLPEEYTQELAVLQDEVPPAPYEAIRERIREELGRNPEELFKEFDPHPIASASLGQVHTARLPSGERVAIKVQYPGIEEVVEADLRALRYLVQFLHRRYRNLHFDLLYTEFSKLLHDELNYIQEGRNAERFRNNFRDHPRIVVPRVYWDYTTLRVLTLEYVEGIKINQFEKIQRAGIPLEEVSALLVESYMIQVFQHRFFHGDPHPGNLFVQPGPKLVFVDFGLMQPISPRMHQALREAALAIIDRDIPRIVDALVDLGFVSRTEDIRGIEQVVTHFMETYRDISPRELRYVDLQGLGREIQEVLRTYPTIQIPNHFILVGRTVGMLNGLNSRLNPNLNIIELARRFGKPFILGEVRPLWEQWVQEGRDLLRTLRCLPHQIEAFLRQAQREGVTTLMINKELTGTLSQIHHLGHRIITGVLVLGLLGMAFYLDQQGYRWLAGLTGGLGGLLGLAYLWDFFRWGR